MQRAGSIFFTRPGLGDHLRDAQEYRARMGDLFAWHSGGGLKPHIGAEFPLDRVADALTEITSGATTGKLLIRV